jgi:hypothetical protein
MPGSYRASGGWRVRVVTLVGTPDRRDGTWLRVTQFGAWTADVGSVAELERFFPLSDLEPDDGRLVAGARLGGRRGAARRPKGATRRPKGASRRSGRRRNAHRRALAVAIVIAGPVSGAGVNPARAG